MKHDLKPIHQQTIVVTGASSGIGRATARVAAARGASVLGASRNEAALREVQQEIEADGGVFHYHVCDVGDMEQVRALALEAIRRFGGFDTWVNNAGVAVYGKIWDVPLEDYRRLMETNFWGQLHGSLAAIEHLRERGGALINIGSITSDQPLPLMGVYSATKHAIKGFTDALRMELEHEGAPVSVTLIKPASINTMITQHAAKHTPRQPDYPPPVYEPEVVADAILYCAEHPQRNLTVGGGGKAITTLGRFAPRLADRYLEATAFRQQQRDAPPRPGNALHEPMADERERGDYPGHVMRSSAYTRAAEHPWAVAAAAGAATAVLMALVGGAATRRRSSSAGRAGSGAAADGPREAGRAVSRGPGVVPRDEPTPLAWATRRPRADAPPYHNRI